MTEQGAEAGVGLGFLPALPKTAVCGACMWHSQNPWPSYARMRIDFALRLRKINRHPENGSAFSFSRQSYARESMPFLPSMASIATRMRCCGVIWIRRPSPTMPD